jgi:hypothetical protein
MQPLIGESDVVATILLPLIGQQVSSPTIQRLALADGDPT